MPGFKIIGPEKDPSVQAKVTFRRSNWWRVAQLGPVLVSPTKPIVAKNLTLPVQTFEEQVITGASLKYKFAHLANWEDVSVTFYDTEDILTGLLDWRDKIHPMESPGSGPSTGITPADAYKDISIFNLVNPQGKDEFSFKLLNSWPKSISHSELSYESSEVKLVTVTISYDWAEEGPV